MSSDYLIGTPEECPYRTAKAGEFICRETPDNCSCFNADAFPAWCPLEVYDE